MANAARRDSHMQWRPAGIACACALACAATVHAETRPAYSGKIEGALLGAPATFDPAAAQSHAELTIAELVFDTLYTIGLGGDAEPHLALGPPVLDATKLNARIAIRKGVKFHDGTTLTPADVAGSLIRARNGPGRWALAPIASVKPVADAIEIVLTSPIDVATLLALAPAAITRPGRTSGARPVGSGPFEIEAHDPGANGKLVLRAFEHHFAGRPYLDRLTLRWHDKPDTEATRFQTDQSQLSARGVAAFTSGQPKFESSFVVGPRSVLVFVGFGKNHAAITGDVGFRRALDLALDRGALAASVNRGEQPVPAGEPVPFDSGGGQPSVVVNNGDLAQAKAALVGAGSRVAALAPGNLPQLMLEILYEETRPDDREIALRVEHALDKLGVNASLRGVSAAELRDRAARGATDLWIGQLVAPVKAKTSWPWWSAGFAIAGSDWASTKLAAGELATDTGHAAARSRFAAAQPIVPIMFRGIKMWHRGDLRGLRFDATGRPCFADLFVFGHPIKP